MREFFVENAAYWIREFHVDGLRLDATQAIADTSPEHVIAAIARRSREAAGARTIILVGENEPQETRLVRPLHGGGYGLDALSPGAGWTGRSASAMVVMGTVPGGQVRRTHERRTA